MSAPESKTQCPHGHAFTPENTIQVTPGKRRCRQCGRESNARWRAEHPASPIPGRTSVDGISIDGDSLIDILAAVVRQALSDYRYGRYDGPHMPAGEFLEACGLLRDDGEIDAHGHVLPERAAHRTAPVRHEAREQEDG